MEVFKPTPIKMRKIIVATNVAESSITIEGIAYVIDSMFCKIKFFDYNKGYENLVVVPISKTQAKQRAGRAGRTISGECYRLCTFQDFSENFADESTPEILRC